MIKNCVIRNWRLSCVNGVLLALYFVPAWTVVAFQIMVSPIQGLFARPNIAVALFISDHLHLSSIDTVRAAWLLALARLTVAGFFAMFLVLILVPRVRKVAGYVEALSIGLGLGSVLAFTSMILAAKVGETQALRLHATELLMLLGTAIIMLVEKPSSPAVASASASVPDLSVEGSAQPSA
ncbi:conserved membrane protein of unknown function [Bradyrhizobium sp. ORS 285]|uniref:hypothetical protein n=1 Tax=Bradyrhizobium sp. ORS 285 TaxID=115808 RepID=UPI000240A5EA|nr:hypothetical protein [Bradyrhizobium sp. ORS 285]CCD87019.1 conserved membrane hypothetical protein [Bradyrhizobium sp. ORS 285]SMX57666.1 conserved membrane protein of unknown function [Bradyrhizobium sp. ORS 285]